MLNEDYILGRMEPYLNAKRELSAFEFSFLFDQLSKSEQYEVIKIMIAHDIEYVDEKAEEAQELAKSPILRESGQAAPEELMALTNEELCVLYQKELKKYKEQRNQENPKVNSAVLTALIENNKRFIMKYVLKCMKLFRRQCLTEDDLFQEGVIGMIKAAKDFDSNLSYSFLTYCGNSIWRSITRAIIGSGFLIRIPFHLYEKVIKVARFRRDNPLATEKQLVEIIRQSGMELSEVSLQQYILYGEYYLNTTSLNTTVGEEDDIELLYFIPDEAALPEQIVEDNFRKEAIAAAIETLSPREKKVITMRFGLDGKEPMTLEQVGEEYNVTKERVRQIETKALNKLHHPSRGKILKSFWET